MTDPIIEVHDLVKKFQVNDGFLFQHPQYLTAVDRVSFSIKKGETLGLVGESGSGKSTVGNCILRLIQSNAGRVLYRGTDILQKKEAELRQYRGKLQLVFQDPQSSLDPRMTVRKIVGNPLRIQQKVTEQLLEERVTASLKDVGLSREHLDRYPHEFSGGQRQRIGIARALITEPDFIVFDEPTSALDVSVQAQILNLITKLQKKEQYAYLFISHDLAVVKHVSDKIAIMYLGAIVESAPKEDFFTNPSHPYTRALISSIPRPNPSKKQELSVLTGDIPSPLHQPKGCRFHTRCPQAMDICKREAPQRVHLSSEHWVDCHLYL